MLSYSTDKGLTWTKPRLIPNTPLQLWSTTITVVGQVLRNGSPELAHLTDISRKTTLELSDMEFDRATLTLAANARIKNTSKETLGTPLKARVVYLRSDIGRIAVTNSDNGMTREGAVWDFGPAVKGDALLLDQKTEARRLVFKLSNRSRGIEAAGCLVTCWG